MNLQEHLQLILNLRDSFDRTFTLDVYLVKPTPKIFKVDSILVDRNTKTFTVDSELVDRYNKTFTIDAVLTTKPTPMIYSDNHLRDITPILASTASGVLSKMMQH